MRLSALPEVRMLRSLGNEVGRRTASGSEESNVVCARRACAGGDKHHGEVVGERLAYR